MLRLILICLMCAPLLACGGGGADDAVDAAQGEADARFRPPDPNTDAGAAANGQLAGRWASFTLTLAQVSGLGGAQEARTWFLQDITQDGTNISVVETMCGLKVDSLDGFTQVRVTPAFIAGVPPETRTGRITAATDGSGNFHFLLDDLYTTRGITLVDKSKDELPTDASDPRIGDWDQDGKPGMTILIDGILSGVAYVIQRDHSASEGTQTDVNHIRGLVTWGADQVMLESNPSSIAGLDSPVFPDSDPSKHYFVQVRVADDVDCAWIIENSINLFGE